MNWTRREILTASLAAGVACAKPEDTLRFGPIEFQVLGAGFEPRRYLLIHGNEETARSVLTEHMKTHSGVAHLVANHTRNVPIKGGEIDPNRMFSRLGAEISLERLNPGWPEAKIVAALDWLDGVRGPILKAITPPPEGLLLALHNNSEGYSLRDELSISDDTSVKLPDSPHEFFLVTDPRDYRILRESPYNVLLQASGIEADDGSLSRLAARQGMRYVNLEVHLGEVEKQREMLLWLEQHLPEEHS